MTRETECMIDMQVLPGLTRYEGKMIGSDVQSQAQGWGSCGHTLITRVKVGLSL